MYNTRICELCTQLANPVCVSFYVIITHFEINSVPGGMLGL